MLQNPTALQNDCSLLLKSLWMDRFVQIVPLWLWSGRCPSIVPVYVGTRSPSPILLSFLLCHHEPTINQLIPTLVSALSICWPAHYNIYIFYSQSDKLKRIYWSRRSFVDTSHGETLSNVRQFKSATAWEGFMQIHFFFAFWEMKLYKHEILFEVGGCRFSGHYQAHLGNFDAHCVCVSFVSAPLMQIRHPTCGAFTKKKKKKDFI